MMLVIRMMDSLKEEFFLCEGLHGRKEAFGLFFIVYNFLEFIYVTRRFSL